MRPTALGMKWRYAPAPWKETARASDSASADIASSTACSPRPAGRSSAARPRRLAGIEENNSAIDFAPIVSSMRSTSASVCGMNLIPSGELVDQLFVFLGGQQLVHLAGYGRPHPHHPRV